jgi:hypothetical protein
MGIVIKAITIPFSLLGIAFGSLIASMVFLSFPLLGNEKMQPTKAEMSTVNLETAMVVRSIQHLSWKSGNLPPSGEEVVVLVVGYDNCHFRERLSYLIQESEATIEGRTIKIESCESLDEASKVVRQENRIMFTILLRSVSKQWEASEFSNRDGLVVYGQGSSYLRRGLDMSSVVQNNRLRLSLNLRKLNKANVGVDKSLLSTKQLIAIGG